MSNFGKRTLKKRPNNSVPSAPSQTTGLTQGSTTQSINILLLTDEIGRGIATSLKEKLPESYSVSSVVRSQSSLAYLLGDIEAFANNFTARDFIFILFSSRHIVENSPHYIKRKLRDLTRKFNRTNLLVSTIPYNHNDCDFNELIYQINDDLEKNLFTHKHSFCVYTNKILFGEDFNKKNVLRPSGREKFVSYISEYFLGTRTDDRFLNDVIIPSPLSSSSSLNIFAPSKSGSTTSNLQGDCIPKISKNLQRKKQQRGRRRLLLKKLLQLLS